MVVTSASIFVSTSFFVTEKRGHLTVITCPTTRLHESFFAGRGMVAWRRLQFGQVVSRRAARRGLIVVATLIVPIVVAWAVHWTLKVLLASMFRCQNRSRDSILGRNWRIIVLVTGKAIIFRRNHHMLWVGSRRVRVHWRVELFVLMPIVWCVLSLDFKRGLRLTVAVR